MKFGDKLIALRKKKGLSQEELAEKLNVSRQSGSKWESNNTYPETDKIVQICNIFECTMDDLINDNITDIESIERKSKNNINVMVDSFLDFITKTINMFSRMKFTSGFKCVIEMIIIALVMLTLGYLFVGLSERVLSGFYPFEKGMEIFNGIIKSVLMLIWAIISFIVLVHVFKIRYLNYYDEIINEEKIDTKEDKKKEEKSKIKEEKKDRIIIRDENTRPFAFLSVLSKIIIMFVKVFVFFFGLFFMFTLLMFAIFFIISLYFSFSNAIFIGSTIATLALLIINVIILMLIIGFIFDKKYNYKILLITFLTSIIVSGIGIGIFALGIKDFKIVDNMDGILNLKNHSEEINYKDNMLITNSDSYYLNTSYKYEIDNNMEDDKIKISGIYDDKYLKMDKDSRIEYKMNVLTIYGHQESSVNLISQVIKDLKNNIIRSYDFGYFDLKITANENTINKLMDNLRKLYNFDYKKENNIYEVYNLEYKISDDTGSMCKYNASNDKLDCGSYNNRCYTKKTNYGVAEYINISCDDDYTTE